jgi:hypothetical protein
MEKPSVGHAEAQSTLRLTLPSTDKLLELKLDSAEHPDCHAAVCNFTSFSIEKAKTALFRLFPATGRYRQHGTFENRHEGIVPASRNAE